MSLKRVFIYDNLPPSDTLFLGVIFYHYLSLFITIISNFGKTMRIMSDNTNGIRVKV